MRDKDIPQDIPKETSRDISKRTIAILLVIAIILSVTSTLIAVARTPQAEEVTEDSSGAQIKVSVAPPPVEEGAGIKVNVAEGE